MTIFKWQIAERGTLGYTTIRIGTQIAIEFSLPMPPTSYEERERPLQLRGLVEVENQSCEKPNHLHVIVGAYIWQGWETRECERR